MVECEILKDDYVIKRSDIVNEITTVLGDWGELFKIFYLTNHNDFQPIRQKILKLIKLRSQILSENLPIDEIKEVKLAATTEIDTGNSMLGKLFIFFFLETIRYTKIRIVFIYIGLDMVVRDDSGNVIDINATSTTQLYELHANAVDRIKRAKVIKRKKNPSYII